MSLDIAPHPQVTGEIPDAPVAPGPVHPLSPVTVSAPLRSLRTRRPRFRPTLARRAPGRRPGGAELRIAPPRAAALTAAALTFGAATVLLAVAALDALEPVAPFGLLLPLLLAAAAVGVGRLASWLPLAAIEWGGPLGFSTAAQWVLLLFVAVAIPELALPAWVPPASGLLAAAPFLWSAVGPRRLRPRLRTTPDAHGRRGALLAAGTLSVITWSMLVPTVGVFAQAALTVLLALAALTPRGLADAGATWDARRWAACLGGLGIAWVAGPLAATLGAFAHPAGHVVLVLAAGLPLLVVERPWRAGR
jgi:hypothetical protein